MLISDRFERVDAFLESISPEAFRYLFPGEENPYQTGPCFPDITVDAEACPSAPHFFSIGSVPEPRRSKAAVPRTKQRKASRIRSRKTAIDYCEEIPEPQAIDEVSPRTLRILKEIERLEKELGVSLEEIEQALSYKVKLSRLRISRSHRIFLDDFDGVEVMMNALDKTVFFFYLNHPEGVSFKQLADYKRELLDIYASISGREDMDAMRSSIDTLTDPFDNSINEKVSRIKKAFLNVVNDRVARFYYIRGDAGTAKSIALDRSLVVFE
ncbi:MAG: hypothetical protein ACI3Y4_02805 [Candidatus Cryptobacteroides sp.]